MGNEVKCTVRMGQETSEGRALLETSEVLFRGEFRLKIPFASIKSVKAVDGELRLETANGLAVFEMGAAAEKWREKILHPKTRIEKIGLKPGEKISLLGSFVADFLAELEPLGGSVTKGKVAERRYCTLDRLSQGTKKHHGERRHRRRPESRIKRCESVWFLRNAHRAK